VYENDLSPNKKSGVVCPSCKKVFLICQVPKGNISERGKGLLNVGNKKNTNMAHK
jgi:hypothetical protein